MTKDQVDKVTYYQTLRLVLDDPRHQPIWSVLPAFVRAVTRLRGSLNVLAALAQSQGVQLGGLAVDKERLAVTLIRRTIVISGALSAFASETGNRTLFQAALRREGTLQKLRDAELDDDAQVLHDLAETQLTTAAVALAEFGLIPARLTELQSAITAYSPLIGGTRAAVVRRKTATDAIPAELTRVDVILAEQLDGLMPQFETAHPAFVQTYENARAIAQSGGARRAPEEESSSSSGPPGE